MMTLIDIAVTREQFEMLDPDTVAMLVRATATDFRRLAGDLVAAVAGDDGTAASAARHALTGLCGHYGASRLITYASAGLATADQREAFAACVEATINAISTIAADC